MVQCAVDWPGQQIQHLLSGLWNGQSTRSSHAIVRTRCKRIPIPKYPNTQNTQIPKTRIKYPKNQIPKGIGPHNVKDQLWHGAMRPPCHPHLEETVMQGVMCGSLVLRVCHPAAPVGPHGIPGVSPAIPTVLLEHRGAAWHSWREPCNPNCVVRTPRGRRAFLA